MRRFIPLFLLPMFGLGCASDETPETPALSEVQLTQLSLGHDLSQPALLNHRIPVSFQLVGESAKADLVATENVAVTFSFVEKGVDANEARGCSSNAIDVELVANGEAQTVDAFIWPTTDCAELVGSGKELTLTVDVYRDGEPQSTVVAVDMPNITLQPGGVDVGYDLTTDSSVALLPFVNEGESPAPSLAVESSLVYNGRDPYVSNVDPENIPDELKQNAPGIEGELTFGLSAEERAELDALPGTATIRYTLSPASTPAQRLPLTIGQEDGSTADAVVIERIDPGIANNHAHDLYIEGATRDAVSAGGAFANETAFVVRGCLETDFTQEGNADDDDCREIPVELVRESAESSAASDITFNKKFERKRGNKRIRIESLMETNNSLSRAGAFSHSEGKIELKGKLGKSFNITIARAFADAELTPTKAFYDAGVIAFNKTIFSASDEADTVLTKEEEFSASKSFRVGSLGFGFGPARIGFTIDVGGRVGLDMADELAFISDEAECQGLLATESGMPGCGRVTRVVTPNFAMTGKIFGGLNLRIVKAGVKADLRFIDTRFPLDATLGFGLTDDQKFLVRGGVDWDMTLRLISGKVYIVGSVGFRRWRKRISVHLFSFRSRKRTFDLFDRSMAEPLELL